MLQAPQIESVSSLSKDYRSIFAKLNAGPVFLTQRSKALAALVSIDDWNQLAAKLNHLEQENEAHRLRAKILTGEMEFISSEELLRLLGEKHGQEYVDKVHTYVAAHLEA